MLQYSLDVADALRIGRAFIEEDLPWEAPGFHRPYQELGGCWLVAALLQNDVRHLPDLVDYPVAQPASPQTMPFQELHHCFGDLTCGIDLKMKVMIASKLDLLVG